MSKLDAPPHCIICHRTHRLLFVAALPPNAPTQQRTVVLSCIYHLYELTQHLRTYNYTNIGVTTLANLQAGNPPPDLHDLLTTVEGHP